MEPTKATRIALSFFALIVGWIGGYGSFCVVQVFSGFYRVTDFPAMVVFPLFFSLAGWAVFVIPLVCVSSPRSQLCSPLACPFVGILGTHLVFLLLLGWWTPFYTHWQYLLYLTVMGATGGIAFSAGIRTRAIQSPRANSFLVVSPLVLGVLFTCVVWHFSRVR